MIWDYACNECGTIRERNCRVIERDEQDCDECGTRMERLFAPAIVMLPERFTKWSRKNLEPTYEECVEMDRRNEEYLAQPKEKPKPDFDTILTAECERNRINPREIYEYTGASQ
jgi:putative FmdB family regulatory protein